jgi:hypothetical protein
MNTLLEVRMTLSKRLERLEQQNQEQLDDDAPHPAWVAHCKEVNRIIDHFSSQLDFEIDVEPEALTQKQIDVVGDWIREVIINHATKGHPLRVPLAVTTYLLENAEAIQFAYPGNCHVCGVMLPDCSFTSKPVSRRFTACPECGEELGPYESFYWNHRGFHPNGLKNALPETFEACVEKRDMWLEKLQPHDNENFFVQTCHEQAKGIYSSQPGYVSYPERVGIKRVG